jgi:hypothetical protein
METIPRRGLLGAAALALTPTLSQAAEPAMYDYLFVDLDDAAPGTTPARAYADHVRTRTASLAAAGGEVVGYFTPQRAELKPTERPGPTDRPQPGGIYVHRWFVVESRSVPEFLALSVEGWRDFEVRFDTKIFGLFTAERSANDRQSGVTRLLLITRYGSHGVWEASRDPSTAAMAAFAKRQALTRDSWAASTLFVPI